MPTGAMYNSNYNRAGRTILSTYNFSPAHNRRSRLGVASLSPEQAQSLPQVKQWSDVTWIGWISAPADRTPPHEPNSPGDLKYIIKHDVVTPSTLQVIEEASHNVQHNIDDEWPGYTFTPETEEYLALLGTPHGM